MNRFVDKTVVVTGGSRSLGRAIACAFGRESARVWVGYHHRSEEAEETCTLITKDGGTGIPLEIDTKSSDSVNAAFAEVLAQDQHVDVLINNAGLSRDNFLPLMSDEEFDDVISVNLAGTFRCCRAVAKSMYHRRSGTIVNVSSVAGLRATPGQTNYAASKGGVESLTRTLAVELASRGVRVNAVAPGFLTTGMALRMNHPLLKRRQALIPLGRSGEADEVAAAVLFLASPEASYIVGHTLVVDGGLSV